MIYHSDNLSKRARLISNLLAQNMSYKPITLFNAYDLQPDPYQPNKIDVQEVVYYCEARFHAALQALLFATEEDQEWMLKILFRELVFVVFSFWLKADPGF